MDVNFSTLAARIAADIQDLRGCVIVSRDGLVLGAHPPDAENILRPAWLRFASLGDVEKGFIQFSGELWVYVRRGPYASFAVSNSVSRPGVLLDELEQVLLAAEEARGAAQSAAGPGGGGLPGSRPRTSLHPEARPSVPSASQTRSEPTASDTGFAELSAMAQSGEVDAEAADETTIIIGQASASPTAAPQAPPQPTLPVPREPTGAPQASPQPTLPVPPAPSQDMYAQYSPPGKAGSPPGKDSEGSSGQDASSGEVDRVALAQEFAQLLGDSGYDEPEDD